MNSASPHQGRVVELEVTDLTLAGEGIGRHGGEVVFVPDLLPGERGRVRLHHRHRRHWSAQLLERVSRSPHRRTPPCTVASRCGGCTLQHLDDGRQREWKRSQVAQALERIGGLRVAVEPLLAPASGLGYRNKALVPLDRAGDGRLRAGFYQRGSHTIVDMDRCPVLDPRLDRLLPLLKQELDDQGWPADVDRSHGGGLRHLGLRIGTRTGQVLVLLISSHDNLPELQQLADRWRTRWPQIVGVLLNLQPEPSNAILGPETRTISGCSWLEEHFAGLSLRIGADTFFQVNTVQAERVAGLLEDALGPVPGPAAGPPSTLIDAYCGIGTFALPLARSPERCPGGVLGLEQSERSVGQANANALRNGLEGTARFEACDVAERLPDLLAGAPPGSVDLVLDPPRRGLEAALCSAIAAHPPRRLAYISCNPATLARDLQRISSGSDLQIRSVQPIDFFPQTTHVECLALLTRADGP
ncbi:23S rRNA (uracil(1939)-C(5))-methyltransferase RlmD [Synechococcus sp. RSCCF101]|uniref:23S rRNA (uracil(1939)-C(5))-methyltransferase RlmD n=1 Tax=Synechococcus sp. RSCCF101 TaxID=2511069 RepID=UPI001CDA2B1E|nr:23S rRNA (uracil(1939)-C(5))-methyltransferase RlmD [Synechococcus sp. RSCCF101]